MSKREQYEKHNAENIENFKNFYMMLRRKYKSFYVSSESPKMAQFTMLENDELVQLQKYLTKQIDFDLYLIDIAESHKQEITAEIKTRMKYAEMGGR